MIIALQNFTFLFCKSSKKRYYILVNSLILEFTEIKSNFKMAFEIAVELSNNENKFRVIWVIDVPAVKQKSH